MVKHFTYNLNCAIFDTSPLIVFKPLSSNGGGTQPGTFLASNMWQIHFIKGAGGRWGPAIEWEHLSGAWQGLIGNANMLHTFLLARQGVGLVLCQTTCVLQWVNTFYVCNKQAEKSKWQCSTAERLKNNNSLMWEEEGYKLEVCVQQIVLLCLQGQGWGFFSPSSPNVPKES